MSQERVILIEVEEPLTVVGGTLTPELIRKLTDDALTAEAQKSFGADDNLADGGLLGEGQKEFQAGED